MAIPGLTRGAADKRYARSAGGLYLPPQWGKTYWQPALAAAGSRLVRCNVLADSVGFGSYQSNPRTKSWIGLMTQRLQAAYGDGGSGWYSACYTAPTMTALGVNANIISQWQANDALWTLSGTWANANGSGPASSWVQTATVGATATIKNVRGTTIKIRTLSNGGGNAAWTYAIDGGAPVSVADGGSFIVTETTVSGLSAGSHTVVVAYNDAGVKNLCLFGVGGYNATGVVVDNYARHGAKTGDFAYYASAIGVGTWSGCNTNTVGDLLIWALGANDYHALATTGVTLTGTANIGTASMSVSAQLQPGVYLVDQEVVVIESCTATTATLSARTQSQHNSGATVFFGRTPDIPGRNALSFVQAAKNVATNGAMDVLFVTPHIGTFDDSLGWPRYLQRLKAICDAHGAGAINFHTIGRNSWNYWNGLHYWGSSTDSTTFGTDGIHMSDAGAAFVESIVGPYVAMTAT